MTDKEIREKALELYNNILAEMEQIKNNPSYANNYNNINNSDTTFKELTLEEQLELSRILRELDKIQIEKDLEKLQNN